MEDLGRRIVTARTRAGLTQAALASSCAVAISTLWRWEKGSMAPGAEHVVRIANACGVTTDWLLRGDEHPTTIAPALTPDEAA